MKLKNILLGLFFCVIYSTTLYAQEIKIHLDKAPIDITDQASLQRGARLFMNHCAPCHSAKFLRYDSLARGIGITDETGKLLEAGIKKNLIFTESKLTDSIHVAMPQEDAQNWFGVVPPDLSLVARSRGVNWLYTYLRAFYKDETKPWGVNNLVFPDTAMPHVLLNLEGVKILGSYPPGKAITTEYLQKIVPGRLVQTEYDKLVADLVNFLSYIGEPKQTERKALGMWVLVFLGIFLVFAYLLKREYWKDID